MKVSGWVLMYEPIIDSVKALSPSRCYGTVCRSDPPERQTDGTFWIGGPYTGVPGATQEVVDAVAAIFAANPAPCWVNADALPA